MKRTRRLLAFSLLAALPAVMGFQLLLSFIGYDMAGIPSRAVWPMLPRQRLR